MPIRRTEVKSNLVVKCPHCGKEFHLCELAMPGELLGKPKVNGIVKDPLGNILTVDWEEEPVKTLEFTCEDCNNDFEVEVAIVAKAKVLPVEKDFSEETVSII